MLIHQDRSTKKAYGIRISPFCDTAISSLCEETDIYQPVIPYTKEIYWAGLTPLQLNPIFTY